MYIESNSRIYLIQFTRLITHVYTLGFGCVSAQPFLLADMTQSTRKHVTSLIRAKGFFVCVVRCCGVVLANRRAKTFPTINYSYRQSVEGWIQPDKRPASQHLYMLLLITHINTHTGTPRNARFSCIRHDCG